MGYYFIATIAERCSRILRFGHRGDLVRMRDLSAQMHLQVTQRSSILRCYGSCMCYTCCWHISDSASILRQVTFFARCFILHIRCAISRARQLAYVFALRLNFNCVNYYENSVMYRENANLMSEALARKDIEMKS
jgi:hypothetical protein